MNQYGMPPAPGSGGEPTPEVPPTNTEQPPVTSGAPDLGATPPASEVPEMPQMTPPPVTSEPVTPEPALDKVSAEDVSQVPPTEAQQPVDGVVAPAEAPTPPSDATNNPAGMENQLDANMQPPVESTTPEPPVPTSPDPAPLSAETGNEAPSSDVTQEGVSVGVPPTISPESNTNPVAGGVDLPAPEIPSTTEPAPEKPIKNGEVIKNLEDMRNKLDKQIEALRKGENNPETPMAEAA